MTNLYRFLCSRKSWTLPYLIFAFFFVVLPLFLIVYFAFTDESGHMSLVNFRKFMAHPEAINTFIYSIGIAIINTILCILLGYPAAFILSRLKSGYAQTIVMLFILPMWMNILIRTLATVAFFDFFSLPLGEGALIFGMTYNFLPFMIYPIYNTLQKMDKLYRSGTGPGCQLFPGILENHFPAILTGNSQWHRYGLYAHNLHFCHCRTADHEQHQTVRNHHSGKYQQQYVELWCCPVTHHAVPDRSNNLAYR